ncbi:MULTISPECIES: AraC family transcriptional regulator [Isoptericola]|uniref:AraC family transcriptional regulator n=1 Tax=Isoptericola sediminis TaxID=2733572 RepID=A0A849K5F6_9MICO|nr:MULTISPECIES: AraC family transcriptional regulator [Isoptericola]MDO8143388.1 AraC family transcriptional regulator [Isoptericola sp. 178]MDO8147251.1 AraC family transcriptional regulator [Isoptericola sp. b515]MDO8150436.1 AraC family transcriptional regulator [Isoptericola sp. b408]NNU27015.1 AraC family transcriptional regulator [Isoptericola sediminis]
MAIGAPVELWPEAERLIDALSPELVDLLDEMSGTMFCAKDVTGRYVLVNRTFVDRANRRSPRDVVGRTSAELFAPELAARYEEQDGRVLSEAWPLRNELELIRRPGGVPGWYLTTKLPVQRDGVVLGLVSTSRDLNTRDVHDQVIGSMARVVQVVEDRLGVGVTQAELAEVAGCTTGALDRRMRRIFGLTPKQFVLRARVDHATTLLTQTDLTLAEVAVRAGFYDQPSFTRTFVRLTGETPSVYRRKSRALATE